LFPLKSDLTELGTKYSGVADPSLGHIPNELVAAIQDVYKPAGMQLTGLALREAESAEYSASRFGLDGHTIVFRVAKTTPTKIGQFVTIWKRPRSGSTIAPLDVDDGVAFVVVSVSDATHRGQFVFDHKILASKGIMAITVKAVSARSAFIHLGSNQSPKRPLGHNNGNYDTSFLLNKAEAPIPCRCVGYLKFKILIRHS
jgi:Uncharacterized protein conserved in bacteria